jgi:hypothetical protein
MLVFKNNNLAVEVNGENFTVEIKGIGKPFKGYFPLLQSDSTPKFIQELILGKKFRSLLHSKCSARKIKNCLSSYLAEAKEDKRQRTESLIKICKDFLLQENRIRFLYTGEYGLFKKGHIVIFKTYSENILISNVLEDILLTISYCREIEKIINNLKTNVFTQLEISEYISKDDFTVYFEETHIKVVLPKYLEILPEMEERASFLENLLSSEEVGLIKDRVKEELNIEKYPTLRAQYIYGPECSDILTQLTTKNKIEIE